MPYSNDTSYSSPLTSSGSSHFLSYKSSLLLIRNSLLFVAIEEDDDNGMTVGAYVGNLVDPANDGLDDVLDVPLFILVLLSFNKSDELLLLGELVPIPIGERLALSLLPPVGYNSFSAPEVGTSLTVGDMVKLSSVTEPLALGVDGGCSELGGCIDIHDGETGREGCCICDDGAIIGDDVGS